MNSNSKRDRQQRQSPLRPYRPHEHRFFSFRKHIPLFGFILAGIDQSFGWLFFETTKKLSNACDRLGPDTIDVFSDRGDLGTTDVYPTADCGNSNNNNNDNNLWARGHDPVGEQG